MLILILILLGIELLLISQPTTDYANRFIKYFILFANMGIILGLTLLTLEIDVKVVHQVVSVFFVIVSTFLFSLFRKIINR